MFTLQRIIISIVAVAFIMGSAGIAFAETNDSKDMNSFICKDIMRLSGENRDIAMAFVHGYFLGKKGATTYKTDKLAAATDEFIETCLDNPNANALKTMGDILKK